MFRGDRFKKLRKEKKLTQVQLGNILNTSHATINRYEKGIHQPDLNTINKIAEIFNVTTDYLLGRENLLENTIEIEGFIRLPIIGVIRAGEPLYAEQNIIGHEKVATNNLPQGELFFLKVTGDSMNLSNIIDGSLIMVRRQEEVENGEIAVVIVNGYDATVKKFFRNGNIVTLMPNSSNPKYEPMIINTKEEVVQVIGKVKQIVIKLED
ncbi:S24 family peptidase [Clostridiaceae bacterium 35-E11]